jgi:hypothetical protein
VSIISLSARAASASASVRPLAHTRVATDAISSAASSRWPVTRRAAARLMSSIAASSCHSDGELDGASHASMPAASPRAAKMSDSSAAAVR